MICYFFFKKLRDDKTVFVTSPPYQCRNAVCDILNCVEMLCNSLHGVPIQAPPAQS